MSKTYGLVVNERMMNRPSEAFSPLSSSPSQRSVSVLQMVRWCCVCVLVCVCTCGACVSLCVYMCVCIHVCALSGCGCTCVCLCMCVEARNQPWVLFFSSLPPSLMRQGLSTAYSWVRLVRPEWPVSPKDSPTFPFSGL